MDSPLNSPLNSPKVSLGITAAAYLLFIVLRLALSGYDPSHFVTAGDRFCDPALVPENLSVLNDSAGYDGQFYYRLALDPFTSKQTDFGITIDDPGYRQQRILYPLTVWAVSLGRPELVPSAMILVNYLAICLMGWVGGLYARSMGRHALWGLAFAFYPGFLLSLARDLTEVLSASLMLTGLLLVRRERHLSAALLLSLATLARETALPAAAGLVLIWLYEKLKNKSKQGAAPLLFLLPLIFYSLWQVWLFQQWGALPLLSRDELTGSPLPFSDFITSFLHNASLETHHQRLWFAEMCFLTAFAVTALYSLRSSSARPHEKLSWLLYGVLVSTLSRLIWVEDWGFMRILSEFYVLGTIVILGSQSKLKLPVFACAALLWLILFSIRLG